ncbi:hypothetical protein PR048_024119 [Dryococelus australis]|uniref:Uncharacterized protein n=1 Tax=Dryococelus australis TaxID=614101 RepID=A0ABQ9GW23_9NEOP|nr:hypothetical protein PR048_024119 [Dryococelus australis]
MRVIEVSMERCRNEGAEGTGVPRENPRPTASSGTIPTCENPGIEPSSPWWEASVLIAVTVAPLEIRRSGVSLPRETSVRAKFAAYLERRLLEYGGNTTGKFLWEDFCKNDVTEETPASSTGEADWHTRRGRRLLPLTSPNINCAVIARKSAPLRCTKEALGTVLPNVTECPRGRGDAADRALVLHHGEPSSIPGGNRAGRCRWSAGFLGDLSLPLRPCIPALLHTHLSSPSSALKTSQLKAAQIPQLHHPDVEINATAGRETRLAVRLATPVREHLHYYTTGAGNSTQATYLEKKLFRMAATSTDARSTTTEHAVFSRRYDVLRILNASGSGMDAR